MLGSSMSPEEAVRKKRVRNWTSDDRAKHRVLERERREAFNDNLMDLASLIPNLKGMSEARLSKHVIVQESAQHHRAQDARLDELLCRIDAVTAEKEELLTEVRKWRQAAESAVRSSGEGPLDDALCAIDTTTTFSGHAGSRPVHNRGFLHPGTSGIDGLDQPPLQGQHIRLPLTLDHPPSASNMPLLQTHSNLQVQDLAAATLPPHAEALPNDLRQLTNLDAVAVTQRPRDSFLSSAQHGDVIIPDGLLLDVVDAGPTYAPSIMDLPPAMDTWHFTSPLPSTSQQQVDFYQQRQF